jgi:hypothetical protein
MHLTPKHCERFYFTEKFSKSDSYESKNDKKGVPELRNQEEES